MKKQSTGNKANETPMQVTASMHEAKMLQCLVEKLAWLRPDKGYSLEKVNDGWKAIDVSAVEAYVDGYINLSDNSDMINISFATAFFFTCHKTEEKEYNLAWSHSLS